MSLRFLSRLLKTHPQRLLSRLYVCRQFSTNILCRQPLASQNLSHQNAWSRYFTHSSSRDDIESSTIYDAELLESTYEPDDDDHHRLQLEIANDAVLNELQQCQSLEEV